HTSVCLLRRMVDTFQPLVCQERLVRSFLNGKGNMKRAKLHEMDPPDPHPGIYKHDTSDVRVYTWYNIASAQVEQNGVIRMPAAGMERTGVETYIHWVGTSTVSPDHPDYAELAEAVKQRGPDAKPHPFMHNLPWRKGRK